MRGKGMMGPVHSHYLVAPRRSGFHLLNGWEGALTRGQTPEAAVLVRRSPGAETGRVR